MKIRRAMPVVHTDDPAASRAFYEQFLGFRLAMDVDGLMMFSSPSVPTTQLIVAWPSATAMDQHVLTVDISIEVDDVDAAHAEARERGLEVVYEIRDEPWGVRRFFVRDPGGKTINVAQHMS
jgi:catechol 2,3-dioxygenase-like lactoylglutathione lyase family enzyme